MTTLFCCRWSAWCIVDSLLHELGIPWDYACDKHEKRITLGRWRRYESKVRAEKEAS